MKTERVPVYPKLELFLTNAAYLVLIDASAYDIFTAAGVDFAWPKTFGGGLVQEFIEAGGLLDREKGLSKIRKGLGLLESMTTTLTGMSTIEDIRSNYEPMTKIQRAIELGSRIVRDPENHERYLAAFETTPSTDVVSFDHETLKAAYGLYIEELKAGKAFVRVRGFNGVAELIGGFNGGRLTVMLGSTGFGKSNFGLNLTYAASQTMSVGYVNMEMGIEDIAKRSAVIQSGKTWKQLDDFQIGTKELSTPNHAIHFTDGRELHVDKIIAWARGLKRLDPTLGLLYIDYDQKMILDTDRDTQEWRAMQLAFRRLEDCAKAIHIHVMIAAQINSDGKISSSHRATFTAHSILTFRRQGDEAIIENSLKHRHARGPRAVPVIYDSHSAKITEAGVTFDLVADDDSDQQRARRKKAGADLLNKAAAPRPYKDD